MALMNRKNIYIKTFFLTILYLSISFIYFNPRKAGLFESSFFGGSQFELPPSYFKKN